MKDLNKLLKTEAKNEIKNLFTLADVWDDEAKYGVILSNEHALELKYTAKRLKKLIGAM